MFVRMRTITKRLILCGCTFLILVAYVYYRNKPYNHNFVQPTSFDLPNVLGVGGDSEDLKSANQVNKKTGLNAALQVCRIPTLEKNRPEVAKFFEKVAPLKCEEKCGPNWLEIDDEGRIQPTEFAKSNIGVDRMECEWIFFDRVNDNDLKIEEASLLTLGAKVEKGDYFATKCIAKKRGALAAKKWHGLFMTNVASKERVAQLKSLKPLSSRWSGLNVYVLGFDSVSQMEFRRNMPKTIEYLENVMKASVFNGFNILGDGTPQAYIPFLTGQTEIELPLTRKRYENANFVDDVYPFVWKNFSDVGYATLYGEDSHGIGTFTYRLKGFRHQPTDHFPATFFHRFESYCTERPNMNSQCCRKCVGEMPQHKMWLRYAESFWREYAELPKFLLMHHSGLSHDSINDMQLADDDLLNHLKKMFESGAFKDTMVIVMADHGRRFSQLRETHQGQLEERLPFFSLFLPPDMIQESDIFAAAAENLRENAKDRLVTHFDMHATLLQLLNDWPTSAEEFKRVASNPKARSLSLFSKIPANRTCEDAGIEAHWCTCLQWQDALAGGETHARTARMLADAAVRVFNEQTEPERNLCAPLKLERLISAKILAPDEKMLRYAGTNDVDGFSPKFGHQVDTTMAIYQLLLETVPGNAKYEATVSYDRGSSNSVTVDLKSISHINAYGDRPHCIIDKNYFLATYCVCYDKI